MADREPPMPPELLEKLKALAAEFKDDHADHEMHKSADSTLSIAYDEQGKWRINYTLPRKAVIAIHNRQRAELAKAQIRGMLADFAFRENSAQQARITELEQALSKFLQLYPNISQLLNGWHADGTAWTEWDECVRRELTAVGEAARKVLGEVSH